MINLLYKLFPRWNWYLITRHPLYILKLRRAERKRNKPPQ